MADPAKTRHRACYISTRPEADIVATVERCGFDVSPVDPSVGAAVDGADANPRLLLVDAASAGGEAAAARLLDAFNVQGGQVLLLGDADEQPAWEKWVRSGEAMFLQRPVAADYLDTLLRDIRGEIPDDKGAVAPVGLDQFGLLFGSSEPMRQLYRLLRKAAGSDAAVFVHGESGTGKELVARSIHAFSPRSEHAFCAINCGAIPSELVESELFGHERGSFSSAERRHHGFFERASKGTLLLDEITEMPESTQVKLLRVLETGNFRRVGGEEDLHGDVRLITATNRDPAEAIAAGVLREDLYYRICQFEVPVPPLRERGDDVPALAQRFMAEFAEDSGRNVRLGADAEAILRRYDWPGNVRELRHVIHSASRLCRSVITPAHLPQLRPPAEAAAQSGSPLGIEPGMTLAEAQRRLILATLEAEGGDRKRAAETLGVSVRTLYNRLKEYRGARLQD